MKLKEWISFNRRFLNCGDFIVKVLKRGSYRTDDILFTTVAKMDVCEKFFGDFEIAKNGISIEKFTSNDLYYIRFLLWVDVEYGG